MPDTDTMPVADAAAEPAQDRGVMPIFANTPATAQSQSHPFGKRSLDEARAILRSTGNMSLDAETKPQSDAGDFKDDTDFDISDPFPGGEMLGDIPDDDNEPARVTPQAEVVDGEEPGEEAAETDETTSPTAEAPEAGEEEQDQETDGKHAEPRKRLRVSRARLGDRNFAILELVESEQISWQEAEARLDKKTGDTPAIAAQGKAEAETPAQPAVTVQSIEAEIAEKKDARKKAAADFDLSTVADLSDEITTLTLQAERVKDQSARAIEQAQTQRVTAEQSAVAQAVSLFPDSDREGTAHYAAVQAEVARLERVNPSAFNDPEWALAVASKTAATLGIVPVKTATKPAPGSKPAPPVVPPKAKARPVPSPAPGSAVPTTPRPANGEPDESRTRQLIQDARKRGDLDAMRTFLRNNGSRAA